MIAEASAIAAPVRDNFASVASGKRIGSLAGLRGVAAYSVLLAHMIDSDFPADPHAHAFAVGLSHFAMSLFFVLSGFVIHYNYGRMLNTASGLTNFFIARFARLYPLYLLVLVIYASLHLNFLTSFVILSHITLTQSWFNTQEAFFTATWSISTEWFFYIGFAGIALSGLLGRINNPARCAFLCVLVTIAVLGMLVSCREPIVDLLSGVFYHGSVSAPVWYWLTYQSPWIRLFEFAIGVLMSMVYRTCPCEISNPLGIGAIVFCVFVVFRATLNIDVLNDFLFNFACTPAIAVILLYSCQPANPVAHIMGSRTMVWAGEISYSVYLLQFFCHAVSREFVDLPILDIALTVAITTVAALLSYSSIEQPAQRMIRRKAQEYLSFSNARPAIDR